MTRPEIIRADSIDLQDRDAPSAQHHHRLKTTNPSNPSAASSSSAADDASSNPAHLAPHQAKTLRGVAAETAEERRVSWNGTDLTDLHLYTTDQADGMVDSLNHSQSGPEAQGAGAVTNGADDENGANGANDHQQQQPQQDSLAVAQNGGDSAADVAEEDVDDVDDGLDDDMMDKISSSPSIEDGGLLRGISSSTLHSPTARPRSSGATLCSPSSATTASTPSGASTPVGRGIVHGMVEAQDLAGCIENEAGPEIPPNLDDPESPQVAGAAQTDKASTAFANISILHVRHLHRGGEYTEKDAIESGQPLISGDGGVPARSDVSAPPVGDPAESDIEIGELCEEEDGKANGADVDLADLEVFLNSTEEELGELDAILYSTELESADIEDANYVDDTKGACPDDAMTIRHVCSDDDDEDEDAFSVSGVDPRCMDSGWGGDCLRDTEDIDFEFVYALHTFVATVEGQANATKGDTMVLLDDSNSYWWLVRVVKDSSIGYLPAEHIETPTERLARLNKHRNIDLSATMLGDQAERTKNPLKSAMRRRKTKTVAFTAPTYVDYSDIDYSTDEEDLEAEYLAQQQAVQQQQQQEQRQDSQEEAQQQEQQEPVSRQVHDVSEDEDETAKVEPLKPRTQQKESAKAMDAKKDSSLDINGDASSASSGMTRTSEEIFVASKSETPGPTKTKDGTVRDSFFKDDTVETKKITLTPNLLRDDGEQQRTSSEVKQRPSLDRIDKELNGIANSTDKKKKDKKGGFRSLFSRKDKKRADNDIDDILIRPGSEGGGDSVTERDADDQDSKTSSPPGTSSGIQRHPSKLQKQNPQARPGDLSPTKSTVNGVVVQKEAATMRIIEPDGTQDSSSLENSPSSASKSTVSSQATTVTSDTVTVRPQKVKRVAHRTAMDDEFESDDDIPVIASTPPQRQAPVPEEKTRQQQQQHMPVANGVDSDVADKAVNGLGIRPERLSESPVQISPVHSNNPPALMVDTSSQEEEDEDRSSPISSPSLELVDGGSDALRTHQHHRAQQDSSTTSMSTRSVATANTSASTATWNDASLRAFFDSGTDTRDLLAVVYDKTDVVPAGPEHPVVGTLFKEQNAKLAEITTQLDNMLGDWLARKQRLRGSF